MGRPRKAENQYLPENLRYKSVTRKSGKTVIYWFYRTTGKTEISLGTDRNQAFIKAAQMNLARGDKSEKITFAMVAQRYKNSVIANKKTVTQKNNLTQLKSLLAFFATAPLEEIEPHHVQEYMQRRQEVQGAANNELALFGHIWKYARLWGYTQQPSPSETVPKYPAKKRDNYVSDEVYALVYQHAKPYMRDLMDIAYLTGQRPVDIASIQKSQISDGFLYIRQQKTGAKLRIELVGKLAEIIQRLATESKGDYLFYTAYGSKLTPARIRNNFVKLRKKLIENYPHFEEELLRFQFRDLRAKSGTDKAMLQGEESARQQLGHTSLKMTQTYIRKAPIVTPLTETPTTKKESK